MGAGRRRRGADPEPHRSRLGPAILAELGRGKDPEAVLRALQRSEPNIGWRQIAAIAADGRAACFTGANITSIAKGRVGRDCVGVGNILRTTEVVDAMVERFEANDAEPLPERLLRALEAGHAAGGELKQVKSAGLVVVHQQSFPYIDLRVDLSPQPLVELRFLWELYRPEADAYVVRAIDPAQAPPSG